MFLRVLLIFVCLQNSWRDCSFLTDLSIFDVTGAFGGGTDMVRDSLADFLSLAISARAAEIFLPPDLIGGICSCHRVDIFLRSHMAGFFRLSLFPKGSLFSRGSEILWGTAPRLREMSWEVFSLPSCLVVQWQKIILGSLPCFPTGLLWWLHFLFIM